MEMRRLLPEAGTTTADEAVAGLGLAERAPGGRPYVVANMVVSADGKAAFRGRSGPLGSDVDRAVFHRLRTQADAVLVGSETLRTERYGRLVRDPELRAAREREGLRPDPLGVVVTRSLDLPADAGLLSDPEQETVVFTSAQRELTGAGPGLRVVRVAREELTFLTVLERLRAEHGVRSVLCEGGPTVLGALIGEAALDELFLTLAPNLAGGAAGPTAVEGTPLSELAPLRLVSALESGGELFLRYAILGG
ncbi:MAG TPA: dihydrofolate reductase family protein [Solirubrobacteraceae bacterium]|nr:dihydrofolate reductase family protein [Solirubrobacteraceae bacterium]